MAASPREACSARVVFSPTNDAQCIVRSTWNHTLLPPRAAASGPCREGTGWMEKVLYRLEHGQGRMDDIDLLWDIRSGSKAIRSSRSVMPPLGRWRAHPPLPRRVRLPRHAPHQVGPEALRGAVQADPEGGCCMGRLGCNPRSIQAVSCDTDAVNPLICALFAIGFAPNAGASIVQRNEPGLLCLLSLDDRRALCGLSAYECEG